MTIIDIIPVGIVRVYVGREAKHQNCLKYNIVYENGQVTEGGMISLSKRYFKASPTSEFKIKWWSRIKWSDEHSGYIFDGQEGHMDKFGYDHGYRVHELVIRAVDNYVIENLLLK